MAKPLQVLKLFSKPKIPLTKEVPIKEFHELVKRVDDENVIAKNAESISISTYDHFGRDAIDLTDLNLAVITHRVFPNIYQKVMERLGLIRYEVQTFKAFKLEASPFLGESTVLRYGIQNTDLVTELIEEDIRSIEKALNRRVY